MAKHESLLYPYSGGKLNVRRLGRRHKGLLYTLIMIAVICTAWYFAARAINRTLVLPDFVETMRVFVASWTDKKVMTNLWITLVRVFKGFAIGVAIGLPLGLLMGYSRTVEEALSPFINSIRQVPIMAWVPLSIIWFGLGDGPTIFLITMSCVFPLVLNLIHGVIAIDPNYKFAARSMGAGTWQIFRDIIFPGALPSFLNGCRMAMGLAWMSVICAEFIATSSGFGFLMVEAQLRMRTPQLYALMIMSALVGFAMDRLIYFVEQRLTSWRFKNGSA